MGHPAADPDANERRALLQFLDAQRACVLAIVDGLDAEALRAPVLPSGWTPLGLIEHLGMAERFWFQYVVTGSATTLEPRDDHDADGRFTTSRSPTEVFAFYRDQCARANAVLGATPLSAKPKVEHGLDLDDEVTDLRWIALHLIEETARHAGHLDVVRELIDGRTGLGPR